MSNEITVTMTFPVPDSWVGTGINPHFYFMKWLRESLLANEDAAAELAGLVVGMTVDHGTEYDDESTKHSMSVGGIHFPSM